MIDLQIFLVFQSHMRCCTFRTRCQNYYLNKSPQTAVAWNLPAKFPLGLKETDPRMRLLWCCIQSSALQSVICPSLHVVQTIDRRKCFEMGCTLVVIGTPSTAVHSLWVIITSPLTTPYPALQKKPRYWRGEVISVPPLGLKREVQEHPAGCREETQWQESGPCFRQMGS